MLKNAFSKVPKFFGNKKPEPAVQPKISPRQTRAPAKVEKIDNLTLEINSKIKIRVLLGDITNVNTDIIVCPANIYLESTSGIAGQLIMKGGLQI